MSGRRLVLQGAGAAVVFGFDARARRWISSADARRGSPFECVPPLDGVLVTDPTSLAAAAHDVGDIVHDTPVAVLRPGSVEDIQKMIRFCRRHRIKAAARGQGHTTFGQAQAEGGLVIEMATLSSIHSLAPDAADVDAGLTWIELLRAAVPQGLTAPVLTGYTGLSIAGTLSVGGISGVYNQGAQVDRARELEVVTGEGDVKRCSLAHNRDLFEAALAGLGQCAIITRAVVDVVPARQLARVFFINYADNATFFADFRRVLDRGEVDEAFNMWIPDGAGGLIYQLNLVKYYDLSQPPDNDQLLRGLSVPPYAAQVVDMPYLDYVLRVDGLIDQLKAAGLWDGWQRPWFDVFLSNDVVERFVGDIIATLTPEDVGTTGFLLLFAQKRSTLTRPLLRVPDSRDWTFLFDILTSANAPGQDPAFVERMLARNRRWFEAARRVGGTRYPISAIPFNRSDWVHHYDGVFPDLVQAKRRYDPDRILTPGPGIF
jgi:cytokinin dehydrogenase